jgi:orotidine-5'-phosphate decarboxylase
MSEMKADKRIIVALDDMDEAEALSCAQELREFVWGFKVNDLLLRSGVAIIDKLRPLGNVFADAKVHEIPNTTKNSVRRLAEAGASLITVHASGGSEMLMAAREGAGDSRVIAVTVLTSISETRCLEIYKRTPIEAVVDFARMAAAAGIAGIVCSPQELTALQNKPEIASLIRVCPGVRPSGYAKVDDQQRVATPQEAIANGATYLVIGRPITGAENRREAAREIASEIGN